MRPAGDGAVLLQAGSVAAAHRLRAALEAAAPAGVRETVVGAGSVLVLLDPLGCDLAAIRRYEQLQRDLTRRRIEQTMPGAAEYIQATRKQEPAPPETQPGQRRLANGPDHPGDLRGLGHRFRPAAAGDGHSSP